MSIKIQLFVFLSMTLLISCNSKRSENIKRNNDSIQTEQRESINWDDEFQGIFIYHFMTDSPFQKERTVESIKNMDYVNYFAEKDYTMHMFPSSKASYDNDLIDDLDNQNQLTVIQGQEIKTYTFLKRNKKWFLANLQISSFSPDSIKGFLKFIYSFSKDTSFRNSHIKFPLRYTYADAERDYDDTTEFLNIKDKSDFNYDLFSDKYFYFFHNDIDKINSSKYICLLLRGIDNGIFMLYYFEKKEDTWQLIEENDSST